MLGPNGPGLGGQTPRHNVSLIPKQTPRFTGQYLQRMTPRHTAQTTQRTSYIFPTLKPSEILQCMNDLQIPFTEEDLAKPTALRMQMAYEAFIDIFMGITAEQFENSEAQLANLVEHPNIYTNSAQLIIFSRHIGRLMREVGIDDFSLRDILKPEPGRVRKIISAVINFAKFREEQMVIYDKYVNQADELAQELEQLQNEQQELQDQISQAKHRRAQDEPQIQKTRDKNTALLEEIKQCLGVQESLVSEVNGLRSEYKELGDTV
ncbi:kinetochore-associated Ndc80 complex subunit nuf2, partial [Dimargaris xerosporica]